MNYEKEKFYCGFVNIVHVAIVWLQGQYSGGTNFEN